MAFKEYIFGFLLQTSRPGWPEKDVGPDVVAEWLTAVHAKGIKTIICLLDDTQLGYYGQLDTEGLVGAYRQAGFAVIHRPVRDHQWPYVSDETLALVVSDVRSATAPILVHCSAGMERSPAVCEYLVEQIVKEFRERGSDCGEQDSTQLDIAPSSAGMEMSPAVWRYLVDQSVEEFRERVTECMEWYSNGRGMAHFQHVTHLAIQLYDMLEDHHRLTSRFRTVLWAGAMLHDIGTDERLAELPGEHGWRSADFIRRSPDQFDCNLANSDEIAMLAALHSAAGGGDDPVQGEVPDWLSQRFGELPKELRWLVAILRVADGLDRGLDQTVAEVTAVDLTNHRILVRADSADVGNNIDRANQKADLLRRVLGCPQLRVERSS